MSAKRSSAAGSSDATNIGAIDEKDRVWRFELIKWQSRIVASYRNADLAKPIEMRYLPGAASLDSFLDRAPHASARVGLKLLSEGGHDREGQCCALL
jgi:hypothetical protein